MSMRDRHRSARRNLVLISSVIAIAAYQHDAYANTNWQEVAYKPLDSQEVTLHISGENVSVDDNPETVVSFYRRLPRDPFVANRKFSVRHVERAAKALEGSLQYANYEPVLVTPVLEWGDDLHADRSWLWRHHQLELAQIYLVAAQYQSEPSSHKYVEAMVQVIQDWSSANYTNPPPSRMSWNDNCTAYRLQNIICAFEYLRTHDHREKVLPLLVKMADTHCHILADPAFYSRHTGHGFTQAYTLYWASSYFPQLPKAQEYREVAEDRLYDEIGDLCTSEGINAENSPAYHIWVHAKLQFIYDMISSYDHEKDISFLETIVHSGWKFIAAFVKPNGQIPLVGDSIDISRLPLPEEGGIPDSATPGSGEALRQAYLFNRSQGNLGLKPPWVDTVFPASGYAVFRDQWHAPENFEQGIYLFFKATFRNSHHRHDDDLSFVLYGLGEDWIVDAGRFNYDEEDSMRQFMRSVEAHNTARPLGDFPIYRFAEDAPSGTGISDVLLSDEVSQVMGVAKMYSGATVTRRIAYRKPYEVELMDAVIVDDETKKLEGIELSFHFPDDKCIQLSDKHVSVSSPDGDSLEMRFQLSPVAMSVIRGRKSPMIGGWRSRQHGKLEKSKQLNVIFQDVGPSEPVQTIIRLIPSQR